MDIGQLQTKYKVILVKEKIEHYKLKNIKLNRCMKKMEEELAVLFANYFLLFSV
jgi:hypothetical protein